MNTDNNAAELLKQAQHRKDNGETSAAIAKFQQAQREFEQQNNQASVAHCLQMIGVCYLIENRFSLAEQNLNQALKIYQTLNHLSGVGNVYRDLGLSCLRQAQYEKARQYMEKSANFLRQSNDTQSLGITLAKSALIFFYQQRFDKAKLLFKQGLTLLRENQNWFFEMTVLLDWARLSKYQEDHHQMITKLWAALGLILHYQSESSHHQYRLAEIYGLLAQGYLSLGNIAQATQLFHSCLQYLQSMPDPVQQNILHSLNVSQFLKQLQKKDSQAFKHFLSHPLLANQSQPSSHNPHCQ